MSTTNLTGFPTRRGGRRATLPKMTPLLDPTPARLAASVLLALLPLCLSACQVLSYEGPNGERFSRRSLGTTTALAVLTVEAGSNGVRRVELRGYHNDSAQALGTVTEAAVRAAIGAAK